MKVKGVDPEYIDNNMLFGVMNGEYIGLSLNNQKTNRSANVLVIGGTGTGKTFKYIKPNLLQENCSMVVTDPSGDIFRSFAPYLLSRGYNVYIFNANDFTLSNNYNPLVNVINSKGEIDEVQVNILVDLYMKNAKAGKEAGGSDPFWDKSEKAFLTALIYYTLEEEETVLKNGTVTKDGKKVDGIEGGQCFSTILKLVQEAKVDDKSKEASKLTVRLNNFYETHPNNKTHLYYDTFLIAPEKTANTILITTAVDLQIFSTRDVDLITRTNVAHPYMNIDIEKMATHQSYLFLGIPQAHQAFNFLIAMLYSQLYGRLYEAGEAKLSDKWLIGYRVGTPVFATFDSKEEAEYFYNHADYDVERDKDGNIVDVSGCLRKAERPHNNDTVMYEVWFRKGEKEYVVKNSVCLEPLMKYLDDMKAGKKAKNKMYIWRCGDYVSNPALPIHVNFLLDEFKNIGEIPNFLTILSTSRKYRIGSHVVIQDIGQIKTMYKENEHETLLANVDTTIFLGSILNEDKKAIQEMLGKTTIMQKSTSSSQSGGSTSYAPTEVDLMSIDEIGAINDPAKNRDDEIVIVRDCPAFVCRKLLLTEHRRFKKTKEASKNFNLEKYYRQGKKKDEENPMSDNKDKGEF